MGKEKNMFSFVSISVVIVLLSIGSVNANMKTEPS